MERSRRISDIWNWLPAFRAVAETQHLPTASEKLHVSPSALSRTIRLLEEGVGTPLFDRVSRELRLNANGEALLRSVRDAMRLVDDGLGAIDDNQFVGPVHVSAVGSVSSVFVVPAIERLRKTHPTLVPHLYNHGARVAHPRLLRGEIDIAFHDDAVASDELAVEQIGVARKAIFCGRQHPLANADEVRIEDILEYEFVAPTRTLAGGTPDGWPTHMQRKVGFYVTDLHIGMKLVREGLYLGVLPEIACEETVAEGQLIRLPLEVIPAVPIFVSRRRQIGPPGRAEAVLDTVRAMVGAGTPLDVLVARPGQTPVSDPSQSDSLANG